MLHKVLVTDAMERFKPSESLVFVLMRASEDAICCLDNYHVYSGIGFHMTTCTITNLHHRSTKHCGS